MQDDGTVKVARKRSARKRTKKAKSTNPGSDLNLRPIQCQDQNNPRNKKDRKTSQMNHEESLKNQMQKYKTEMCRHWEQFKTCALGDACSFAHGAEEKRNEDDPLPTYFPGVGNIGAVHSNYKTKICKNFQLHGSCKFGNRCGFAHGHFQLRGLTDPLPMVPEDAQLYSPNRQRSPRQPRNLQEEQFNQIQVTNCNSVYLQDASQNQFMSMPLPPSLSPEQIQSQQEQSHAQALQQHYEMQQQLYEMQQAQFYEQQAYHMQQQYHQEHHHYQPQQYQSPDVPPNPYLFGHQPQQFYGLEDHDQNCGQDARQAEIVEQQQFQANGYEMVPQRLDQEDQVPYSNATQIAEQDPQPKAQRPRNQFELVTLNLSEIRIDSKKSVPLCNIGNEEKQHENFAAKVEERQPSAVKLLGSDDSGSSPKTQDLKSICSPFDLATTSRGNERESRRCSSKEAQDKIKNRDRSSPKLRSNFSQLHSPHSKAELKSEPVQASYSPSDKRREQQTSQNYSSESTQGSQKRESPQPVLQKQERDSNCEALVAGQSNNQKSERGSALTDRSASSNLSTRSGPSVAEVQSALVALAIKDGVSEELAKQRSEIVLGQAGKDPAVMKGLIQFINWQDKNSSAQAKQK